MYVRKMRGATVSSTVAPLIFCLGRTACAQDIQYLSVLSQVANSGFDKSNALGRHA